MIGEEGWQWGIQGLDDLGMGCSAKERRAGRNGRFDQGSESVGREKRHGRKLRSRTWLALMKKLKQHEQKLFAIFLQ